MKEFVCGWFGVLVDGFRDISDGVFPEFDFLVVGGITGMVLWWASPWLWKAFQMAVLLALFLMAGFFAGCEWLMNWLMASLFGG